MSCAKSLRERVKQFWRTCPELFDVMCYTTNLHPHELVREEEGTLRRVLCELYEGAVYGSRSFRGISDDEVDALVFFARREDWIRTQVGGFDRFLERVVRDHLRDPVGLLSGKYLGEFAKEVNEEYVRLLVAENQDEIESLIDID